MLALQGPASDAIVEKFGLGGVAELRRFRVVATEILGRPGFVSKTGYTGSAGYEIYLDARVAEEAFRTLLKLGEPLGLLPAGLGARDTLRLEAALSLYGHELDQTTSPLEAGLERFVKREAGGFIGAEAIEKRASEGHRCQLVGFELTERGIARADYPLEIQGEEIGRVTSGAPSPSLGKSIGLGYVTPDHASLGTKIDVVIRGKRVAAKIVATPFV
jgi:aminomethyltransferase